MIKSLIILEGDYECYQQSYSKRSTSVRTELERRRYMLQYDAQEHKLVNEFYKLKPRKSEVNETVIH